MWWDRMTRSTITASEDENTTHHLCNTCSVNKHQRQVEVQTLWLLIV